MYISIIQVMISVGLAQDRLNDDTLPTVNSAELVTQVKLLVTDDFKFFKVFMRSSYAYDILSDLVMTIFKAKHGISVKLAGEIIDHVCASEVSTLTKGQ